MEKEKEAEQSQAEAQRLWVEKEMRKESAKIGRFPKAVTVPAYTETNMQYWKYRFSAELKSEYVAYIDMPLLAEGDPRQGHEMFKDYPKLGKEPFTDVRTYCEKLQWKRASDLQALVPHSHVSKARDAAIRHEKAGPLLRAVAWLFEEAEKMTGKGEAVHQDAVRDLKHDIRVLILNAMNFILAAFQGTHNLTE